MASEPMRARLVFESNQGVTVMYGDGRCTELELLTGFVEEKLYFGDPPFRLDVREIPADVPMLTLDDFREVPDGR